MKTRMLILLLMVMILASCGTSLTVYHDPNMDFGAIRNVAIMPFSNLTRVDKAQERVRDVFMNMLLATGNVYVIPPGEVARGISRIGISDPTRPSTEEILKLAPIIKADSVITGVVKEYGEVKSGTATGNIISLSVQLTEAQTGKVVWTASTTEGGISFWDRLFGGGGRPLNDVTEKAVIDVINRLF